ncbi:hypothetical protein [Emticicia sp. C21]|uniref:hypothetical protein n=1 Tax=Emticicia sp. C21 TaxID=2302915 RepID=UPI000E357E2E|nr:hypothetical protein [Emticicia sp. C21]RFS16936.1 hypothetical protein D0T08_09675 [Emticicia sp. C21]
MKYNFIRSVFQATTILERERYESINHLLDEETKYFLYEFGLPNSTWFSFEFTNSEIYNAEYNILNIGNNGRKFNGEIASYIGIDLNSNEIVMFYNFAENEKCFLGLSLKHFILTMFEFEMFTKEICVKKYFGEIHSQEKKSYLEYLNYRLLQLDKDFYANDRSYYWGSILEGMEQGVVQIVDFKTIK